METGEIFIEIEGKCIIFATDSEIKDKRQKEKDKSGIKEYIQTQNPNSKLITGTCSIIG